MRTLALAALMAALAAHSPAGEQPAPKGKAEPQPKTDQELIQGNWLIVGLEAGGKQEPEKNYKDNTFTFAKDRATLREKGFPPVDFTFALDPTKTPKAIDLTPTKGGGTVRGVYKLDGDDLTLCLSIGGARPTEFATKAGGDTEAFTLKRNRWERYSDKAFGYSVDMPGKPEERKRQATTPAGELTTMLQVVRPEGERVSYLVSVTPLPGKLDEKGTEAALAATRERLAAEVDGGAKATVEADRTFNRGGGQTGRELTLGWEYPGSKEKGSAQVRLFVAGGRLYGLMVAGPEDGVKAAAPDVTRFWASFRIAGEKKKG